MTGDQIAAIANMSISVEQVHYMPYTAGKLTYSEAEGTWRMT